MANVANVRSLVRVDLSRWRAGLPLWCWWVLFNAAGGLLGEALLATMNKLSQPSDPLAIPDYSTILILFDFSGAIIWLVLALFQWLVLSRYLPGFRLWQGILWMVASAAGGAVAVTLGFFTGVVGFLSYGGIAMALSGGSDSALPALLLTLTGLPFAVLFGAIPGAVVGIAQGLIFLRIGSLVVRWVIANTVGWAFGSLVLAVVSGSPLSLYSIMGGENLWSSMAVGGIVVTGASLVTGAALALAPIDLQHGNRMSLAIILPVLAAAALFSNFAYRLYNPPPPAGQASALGKPNSGVLVAWSPDGKRLASGGLSPYMVIWDVASRQAITTFTPFSSTLDIPGVAPYVSSNTDVLAWSPDGHYLAVGSWTVGMPVKVLDTQSWKPVHKYYPSPEGSVESIAWSPDGNLLALGTLGGNMPVDGTGQVWDVASEKRLAVLHNDEPVHAVAWSPDGRRLAMGTSFHVPDPNDHLKNKEDWAIVIAWEPRSQPGDQALRLKTAGFGVDSLAWSPDGKLLAAGLADGPVRLWDTATWQVYGDLTGHSREVDGMSWSPDGKSLASGSWDLTVRIWDVGGKREIDSFKHPDVVRSVSWSPDGHLVASGCNDDQIRFWDAHSITSGTPTPAR